MRASPRRRLLVATLVVAAIACSPLEPRPHATRVEAVLSSVALLSPFDFARLPQGPAFSAEVQGSTLGQITMTFQVSAAADFSAPVYTGTEVLSGPGVATHHPSAPLPPGTLSWRVTATPPAPESPLTSAVRSLTVDPARAGPDWFATTEPQFRSSALVVLDQTSTSRAVDGEVIVGFSTAPVFFDDFESGTLAAWTVTTATPPTVEITNAASTGAPSGSRVMKVVDLDPSPATVNAMHDWGSPLGRGAIDFSARVDAAGPRFEGGFLRAGVTNYATSLVWGDLLTVLYLDNFSVITDLTPPVSVAADTWHRYRIEYEDRGTYELFLDGARIGTGLPMQSRGDVTRVNAHTSIYYTALVQDFELDDIGVYPGALAGSWASPPISVSTLGGTWQGVSWTGSVGAGQRLAVQVERPAGPPGTWTTLEDSVLPGNGAGFTLSPVSLLLVDPVPYPTLRIKVLLSRAAVADTSPRLDSLTVSGGAGPADAGPPDAGPPDAGPPDAGGGDGGAVDGGGAADGGLDASTPVDAGDADAGGGGDAGADGGAAADGGPDGGEPGAARSLRLGCSSTRSSWPLVVALAALPLRRRRRGSLPRSSLVRKEEGS